MGEDKINQDNFPFLFAPAVKEESSSSIVVNNEERERVKESEELKWLGKGLGF